MALPPGMAPAHKLSSGQSLALDFGDLASLAPGLVEYNQQADDRPADVELPAPQDSQLTLVYADRLFTVPLKLSYALNANYDPKQSQRSAAGCAAAYYLAFGLPATAGLCLALLLLLAAGLLLRALWRRRSL